MFTLEILVKYCGGCNCQIDRSKLIQEIQIRLPSDDHLVADSGADPAKAGILLCGCQSACAWKPELSELARRWILVAGKSVENRDAPEADLPRIILQKIQEIKNRE